MQILVVYYSQSGNTEKLAQAVGEGAAEVDDTTVIVKSVDEVTKDDFLNCDGLIVGSPVYFGVMAAPLKEMFDTFVGTRKKMENKVGAAFVTSGDLTGGKETTIMSILQCMLIYGMVIVGDPMDATGHYGVACTGAPDGTALLYAKKLGKRVAELISKING